MSSSLPIAMYHHVNGFHDDMITVHLARFEEQMRRLAEEGWQTLTLQDLEQAWETRKLPSARSVLLTFDDAWLDVYQYAYPIMKKYGHHFTVFVVGNWTEQASRHPQSTPLREVRHIEAEKQAEAGHAEGLVCTWSHLEEMRSSGLADLANHTADHNTWGYMDNTARVVENVQAGAALLQQRMGIANGHLCWPRGKHSAASIRAVAQLADVRYTYLVRRGANLPGKKALGLHRFTADNVSWEKLRHSLNIFSRPLAGELYARLKPDRWKDKLKRLCK